MSQRGFIQSCGGLPPPPTPALMSRDYDVVPGRGRLPAGPPFTCLFPSWVGLLGAGRSHFGVTEVLGD